MEGAAGRRGRALQEDGAACTQRLWAWDPCRDQKSADEKPWTSGQGQPTQILPGYNEDFAIMQIEFFEVFETVNVRLDCKKLRWMQGDQLGGLGERILLRARGEQSQKDQTTRTYTSPTFFSSNVFSLFYPPVLSYWLTLTAIISYGLLDTNYSIYIWQKSRIISFNSHDSLRGWLWKWKC